MPPTLARAIRARCHVAGPATTDDIESMLASEGIVLDPDLPFGADLLGVCVFARKRPHVAVRCHLPSTQRRRVLLHEFAHALLHAGNQLLLSDAHDIRLHQQERKAEMLALHLACGDEAARRIASGQCRRPDDLAEWAGLPPDFVAEWWPELVVEAFRYIQRPPVEPGPTAHA